MKNYILIIFLSFADVAFAQIPSVPRTLLGPNASGLGLYGEIPVSLFTGTPSIEVPLYELHSGSLVLPLSLSYHASGVRPDQRPGWVGLGWSLNAGGVISRIVNDQPDEYNNSHYGYGKNAGFYFNHNVLNTASWNQRSYLRQIAQTTSQTMMDTAPDEFSFNFLDYHGKFMLDHTGQWVVQCDRPVKVIFNNQFLEVPFKKTGTQAATMGYFPSFCGFTLLTEDGSQYVFGGTVDAIDYSIDFFAQYIDEWIATSWYLTKIISPNKEEITLSYERGDFTNQMMIAVRDDLGSFTESSGGIFDINVSCSSYSYSSINSSYQGKLISPVYLYRIKSLDTWISFVRNPVYGLEYSEDVYKSQYEKWVKSGGYPVPNSHFLSILSYASKNTVGYPKCLDNLKSDLLSKIAISKYNSLRELKYFILKYKSSETLRPMLTGVEEFSIDKTVTGRVYGFEYDHPEELPAYLSNQVDHWGFYNATPAPINYAQYSYYRNPNASVLRYGILTKIVYPTGSYTRFEYEPHDYRKQLKMNRWEGFEELSSNKIAGGLRIKKIINSPDSLTEIVSKEYFYATDYFTNKGGIKTSSGILGGQTKYYYTDYIVRAFNDRDVRRKMSIFSSQSVLPCCENSSGCHIGYTEVIEKNPDSSLTRYRFTNFDNGHLDQAADAVIQESHTPYEPYTSKALERGHLILKEDYGLDGLKKRSKTIEYEPSSDTFVRVMLAGYKNVCPNTAVSYDEGTTYRVCMYNYRMVKEVDTSYDSPIVSLSTSTFYTYNVYGLPREIKKTVNNGTKIQTYKRVDEYESGIYPLMESQHVLSPVVESVESLVTSGAQTPVVLKKIRYDYTACASVSDYCFPLSSIKEGYGTGALKETYLCRQYDNKGNPVYVTRMGEQDVVYLWDKSGLYMVAEIVNATFTEVDNALKQISGDTDFSRANQLRSKLPDAHIFTFQYDPPIGVTMMIDAQGKQIEYRYDGLGRLSLELDENGFLLKKHQYKYAIDPEKMIIIGPPISPIL